MTALKRFLPAGASCITKLLRETPQNVFFCLIAISIVSTPKYTGLTFLQFSIGLTSSSLLTVLPHNLNL